MKKKLSIGLVLAIVLILVTVTALAATLLWEQYAAELKQIEHEQGEYEQWPLEEKLSLVESLIDMGYLEESDSTKRLFDEAASQGDRQALADELMLELTGQTDIREINLDIITYAILGTEDTWTPEQRVWWQEITNMYRGDAGDPDTLITPGGGEIAESEAIAIAKAAILKAYELPEDALDQALPVANLYITKERPDYKRWDIQFKLFREGSDNWLERVYTAIIDESGHEIADPDVSMRSVEERAAEWKATEEIEELPIVVEYKKYSEKANGNGFQSWPVDLKAAYSQAMRPMAQAALESGELRAYDAEGMGPTEKAIIASTIYVYGLPDAEDIQEEEALELAKQALQDEYGKTEEDIAYVFTFYDVTDADTPKWRFLFYPVYQKSVARILHRVELNARTGEIVSMEAFEGEGKLDNLENDLKWH